MLGALDKFRTDAVVTASPARLLIMLYDRLILDLERGELALSNGNRQEANNQLAHAQDIISELMSTLNVEAWEGAPNLLAIYAFCLRELVSANVGGDVQRVKAVRTLLEPLRQAWHEAAGTLIEPAAVASTEVPRLPGGELGVG